MSDRPSRDFDPQVFECQECGKRTADDGADALLGWFRDGDGELSFCAECGLQLGPPSQDVLDRFHAMYAREHAGRILALLDDPATTVLPPASDQGGPDE